LIHRISGESERTFADFIPIFEKILDERSLEAKNLRWMKQRLQKYSAEFGDQVLSNITTLSISEFIDSIKEAAIAKGGNGRIAQVYRKEILDFFNEAQAKGWVDSNPVTVTKQAKVKVQRERLTLEAFQEIYLQASQLEPWVSNSMALALVTGQAREDISELQFKNDVHDGFLWNERGKTGAKIKIPLSLRLDALGWTVGEVIERCRDRALSRYIIHNSRKHAKAEVGLSAGFAKARDMTTLKWAGTPPTFHEIRSLAERLYSAQGIDTQTLLGHKNKEMTAVYHDVRGAEWLEVKV
jgi:integrase